MHFKLDIQTNQAWANLRIGVCADVVVREDMKFYCKA